MIFRYYVFNINENLAILSCFSAGLLFWKYSFECFTRNSNPALVTTVLGLRFMKEQLVHLPRTELDMMESNRDIATGGDDGLEKELQSVEEEITYIMLYKHS